MHKATKLLAFVALLVTGCRPNAPVPATPLTTGGPGAYVMPVSGSNAVLLGQQGSFSPLGEPVPIDRLPLQMLLADSTIELTFTNLGVRIQISGSERLMYQGASGGPASSNTPVTLALHQSTNSAVWRVTLPTNRSVALSIASGTMSCVLTGSAWFEVSAIQGRLIVLEGTVYAVPGPPNVPPTITVPAGSRVSHVNWIVNPASGVELERVKNIGSPVPE